MIYTAAVKQSDVVLPQRNTKIYRCFQAIGHKHPLAVMTAEVARDTTLNNKETAALLVALQARGLIQRASERRGMSGGSEWRLTTIAESYFRRRF
jgi:DNA-binding IclR family transcriptional regulator